MGFQIFPTCAILTCLAYLLVSAGNLAAADKVDLQPKDFTDSLRQVHVDYQLEGSLKLNHDGKGVRKLPLQVKASLFFDERPRGLDSLRAARYFHTAEADIEIHTKKMRSTLTDEKRFIAVYWDQGRWISASPVAQLTRDEAELLETPGNSLKIHELLPSQPKSVGDEWKHADELLAVLVNIQAVTKSDVKSQLKEVKNGVAAMELSGTLTGAVEGVATDIDLKAKYRFDLKTKMITWFALGIREKRSIGHAVPGFEVVGTLRMQMRPIKQSNFVSDGGFPKVDEAISEDAKWLTYTAPQLGCRHLHDPRWQVMGERPDMVVLRMVDEGDLIAQCNVSKLADSDTKNQLPLASYQADIQLALGKHFVQFIEAGQQETAHGLRMLRVVAGGMVSEVPMQWIYYHVSDKEGRRASVIVTVEEKLAEKLRGTDSIIANTMELFEPTQFQPKNETAAKPNPTDSPRR